MKGFYKIGSIIYFIFFIFSSCNQESRIKEYLIQGNEALRNRNYPLALQFYEKAIDLDSTLAEAYNNMGITYFETGDDSSAILAYTKAIRYKPEMTDAYFNRSNVFYQEEKYEKALQDLKIVLDDYEDSSYVYFSRARVYLKTGNFEKAILDLDEVIQLDPQNPDAYDSRGYLHYRQRNLEKAKKDLEKAIQLNSKQDFAYANLGLLMLLERKDSLALEYFNTAIEISNIEAYHFACRARYFFEQENLKSAQKDVEEGLRLDNQNPDILLMKTQLLFRNLEEALPTAQKVQKINPYTENLAITLGDIYLAQDSLEKACEYWKQAVTLGEFEARENLDRYCE